MGCSESKQNTNTNSRLLQYQRGNFTQQPLAAWLSGLKGALSGPYKDPIKNLSA